MEPNDLPKGALHLDQLKKYAKDLSEVYKSEKQKREELETANRQLEKSEAALTEAQRIARLGSWELNIETNELSWSKETYRIFGFSPDEFVAAYDTFIDAVHSDDRDIVRQAFDAAAMGREPCSIEHRIVRPDGETRVVQERGEVVYDEAGRPFHMIGTIQDITERKHLEDQLFQAQKMESVGQLAGGVAHDFNNFLMAIMSYASLIQMKLKEDSTLKNYAEQILLASRKAADLTQSLLAFSRKLIINLKPTSLNTVLERTNKFISRVIGEDIKLETRLSDSELNVRADSGRLDQVLLNLATNARDAMPDGGRLTIETEPVRLDDAFIKAQGYGEPGMFALISVTDTGKGMDEKTREKIFEPFFTTKEIGKGTGLGLSVSHGIIKQHNGYINVDSEPGRGTAFKIYLPMIESGAFEDQSIETAPPVGGNETILIAEDESDVRKILKIMLEDFGYKIIEAFDGENAVKKFMLNKDEIALVILDVIMPKKNGKEAYDEINILSPEVKALFISGYTAEIVHKKGILDREINFISKPVSPNELLKKVREVLGK